MTVNNQSITLWHSTLGMGDSHDFATRGYLKALMEVGYQGLRIPPSITTSLLRFDDSVDSDIAVYAPLVKPYQQMKKPKLVEKGDPRIGTTKIIDGSDLHGNSTKVEVTITEGSVDLDVPQEFSCNVPNRVQCVVIHHDPASICRNYTNLVKTGRPPGVAYVGVTVWEPSSIPEAVAQILSELDLIIVPSQHCKELFISSGVSTVVEVVQHTFDLQKWPEPSLYEISGRKSRDKYIFYTIANPIERKNLKGLVRAYFNAFSGCKDVFLRIKSGEKHKVREIAQEAFKESGISSEERPPLKFFLDSWSVDKIRGFHLDGDCFVSATRGEGFGLCELEAKLCNSRVITTGWGACTEFINEFGSSPDILIPYKLIPVFGMYGIGCYEVDQRWAEPDHEALVNAMQKAKAEDKTFFSDFGAWKRFNEQLGSKKIGERLSILLRLAQQRVIEETAEDELDGL